MSYTLAKASATFSKLHKNVWNRRGITTKTKIKVYRAFVLTTLLYGCETCTVYQRHARKLNHFHTTCLRKLLGIKWQDKIPDTEFLTCADLPSIYTILMQSQLRWAGHVVSMSDERLPKNLLFEELHQGKRSQGGQKKRFKDTLKALLKAFNISHNTWEQSSQGRAEAWRSAVHKGAKACETNRNVVAEERRQARKKRAKQPYRSRHHCLSTLPQTLSDADRPDQSSAEPQNKAAPTPRYRNKWSSLYRLTNNTHTRVCPRSAVYARIRQSMPMYTCLCLYTPVYAHVLSCMPMYTRVCP